jgi:hypothetical protein
MDTNFSSDRDDTPHGGDASGKNRASLFTLTFGQSKTQSKWPEKRSLTFPELADLLADAPAGPKDGPCYVPAVFTGVARRMDKAARIDVAVLDADCGHTIEEIRAAVTAKGWRAIIHSTHSHMIDRTEIAEAPADKWLAANPGAPIGAYMAAKAGYLQRVAEGAVEVERTEDEKGARNIIVRHRQCPKYRVLLPLAEPWVAADYASQAAANETWAERIATLAGTLRLHHDKSCSDPSRLFFLPRRRADGPPHEIEVLDGEDCPLFDLPAVAPVSGAAGGLFDGTAGNAMACSAVAVSKPPSEARAYTDPDTGEVVNLTQWAAKYASRFEIATALKSKAPEIFSQRVTGVKQHILCPNSGHHITQGAEGTGTFIVNSSLLSLAQMPERKSGFVIHCSHNGCKLNGNDRLHHLAALLADRQLSVADLTDPAFLTPEPEQPDTSALVDGMKARAVPDAAEADIQWPEPVDFLGDADVAGVPQLRREHLPEALAPFVFDTAERMGAEPAAVALAALVALASVMDDAWAIQPKRHDTSWQEHPRIWGAIIGDPSVMKSPVIAAVTLPIDRLETAALTRHIDADMAYQSAAKFWKASGSDPGAEPKAPIRDRYMVEGTTIEALSEVLRAGGKATQKAVAGKVLIRQDEMAEWIGSFDRYKSGGSGGGDRGAYCRLYNGGRNSIDRVGRGVIDVPNWSACILGGIQPEPIQRMASASADDGLLQRFSYCVANRQPRGVDRAPNMAAIARYESLFAALATMRPPRNTLGQVVPIQLSDGAQALREAMLDITEAMAVMPDVSNRMKSALDKWRGLVPRMGLIFHLINAADAQLRGEEVDLSTLSTEANFRMATTYIREVLLPHLMLADSIMFGSEQTNHAKWIADFILSRGMSDITRRDIIRAYKGLRRPEDTKALTEVTASLEAVGWIMSGDTGHPLKAPSSWMINPRVHKMFAERAKREKLRREDAKTMIAKAAEKRKNAIG